MRWRSKEGHKRGRRKRENGVLGRAYDFGFGVILGFAMIFGDLRNMWRFLGLLRGVKYCSSWSGLFILYMHTTSGWTWAWRAREPVEVS